MLDSGLGIKRLHGVALVGPSACAVHPLGQLADRASLIGPPRALTCRAATTCAVCQRYPDRPSESADTSWRMTRPD
jgi:hypothetical protein